MNKAYKFRLYPNKEQEQKLAMAFGCTRFVYNYFLNERKAQYEQTGKSDNYYSQTKKLTELKNEPEYDWLYEVNSQALQNSLKHLENAYVNFFSKRSSFPKFHKKNSLQTFEITQSINLNNNRFYMPKFKKDGIRCKITRNIDGKICSATISKTPSNKYYVSIVVEELDKSLTTKEEKKIGIDLGIKHLLITSDGQKFDNPKYINKYEKELKIAQQHLSRKVKGSRGFENQRLKVAEIQEKISNCRKDNLHKISFKLANECTDIFLEDLNIIGMKKNHHLAKSISDCSWSTFTNMLEYKGKWYGCNIHYINRYYPSSKTCSNCNYTLDSLSLNTREWVCPKCGTHHDRDINAAINILNEGIRELSAGTVDYTGRETVRLKSHNKRKEQVSMKSESRDFSHR